MLALAFVAMLASSPGQSYVIAVFLDEMLAGTGLSRTEFSALYAAATVVSATVMMGLGRATDRFGVRGVWAAVSLALATACAVASLASGLVVAFVALALLRTFGQGSFPLVGTLIVARFFEAARGRAMAVATFGITLGSIALPPLVVVLIVELGWRDAFRVLAVILVVLVLPLAALVRREPAPVSGEGEESGADEAFPPALRRSRRLRGLTVPTRSAAGLLFVLSAPPLVMTALIFHAVSLLGEVGLSLHAAGAALSVLGIGSAAGTIVAGVVSDRIGTRPLLAAMCALLTASAALLLVPTAPAAYVAFVVLGLSGGVFGVAIGVVWARTYGLAEIGRLQGVSAAVMIGGAAAGPLPLALSLGVSGSYVPALVALTAYGALALTAALRWRDPRRSLED